MTLFAVSVVSPVPPFETGTVFSTATVPSPRDVLASAAVAAFVPPLAIGRTPVTPVVRGRPVALVKTPDAGVPRAGAVIVAELIVGLVSVLFVNVCVAVVETIVAPPAVAAAGRVAVPVAVRVPATVKVLPAPTFKPTDVPLPAALNTPSTVSRSVFSFVPQVSRDAPTSGLVKFKFTVNESAM